MRKHLRIRKNSDQGPERHQDNLLSPFPSSPSSSSTNNTTTSSFLQQRHLSRRRLSLDPSLDTLRHRRVSLGNERDVTSHLTSSFRTSANKTNTIAHATLPGSTSLLRESSASLLDNDPPGSCLFSGGLGDPPSPARPIRSSLPHIGFSARNEDWNSVQQSVLSMFRREKIEPSELVTLGAKVKELSKSDIGPFIYDYYKNQLLMKGMRQMRDGITKNVDSGNGELEALGEAWDYFYREILPLLHYILHTIATKDLSIKQATLVAFRDSVLFRFEIKDLLEKRQGAIPPNIQQMLLVLQSVPMEAPPCDEYLRLETLVALVVNPYLGYRGLYEGSAKPSVSAGRTESTRRKKTTTEDPGLSKAKTSVIPSITVNSPDSHTARRGMLQAMGRFSQPSMTTSTISLTPVVENEHELRRHSFSMA